MTRRKGEVAAQTLLAPSDTEIVAQPSGTEVGEAQSSSPVLEAAVERILSTLNCEGLSKELTTKLAEQLLSKVKVDDLVTSLLSEHADELTVLMKRRLMEKLLMQG